MIDIKLLRENPDLVRASQRARGDDAGLVDRILELDEARRSSLQRFEALRAEQKSFGKQVAQASGEEKQTLLQRAKEMAAEVKTLEAAAGQAGADQEEIARQIGNIVIDGVPPGPEENFTVVHEGGPGERRTGEREHQEIGEGLGIIDVQRGADVAGSRFYYLKGWGARLEWALMAFAQRVALEEGFTPLVVPNLVKAQTMAGAGFIDKHSDEIYYLPADELYLTGTSEVGLLGYHLDTIVDLSEGPLRYCATSTCYRREAGSAGRDTKGIFRVHQFQKTEMVVVCRVEDAEAEHARLVEIEKRMLDALEIPYRIIDCAAGDLSGSAARRFDGEVWFAGQERFRELTSTSNCTTYQARRLSIREKDPNGPGNRTVATLNGTMLTSTRPIAALLEYHAQPDGSVRVPAALAELLGTDVIPVPAH